MQVFHSITKAIGRANIARIAYNLDTKGYDVFAWRTHERDWFLLEGGCSADYALAIYNKFINIQLAHMKASKARIVRNPVDGTYDCMLRHRSGQPGWWTYKSGCTHEEALDWYNNCIDDESTGG